MNKVILMGRLTRDPDIRYSQGEKATCIARYTLAVDRRFRREGEQSADFISCVTFGKSAEFADKYLRKGTKITVSGRIQTGRYEKDGQTVYTTDVVVEEHEFAESKAASAGNSDRQHNQAPQGMKYGTGEYQPQYRNQNTQYDQAGLDGFMNIPDGIDGELPFS